MASKLGFGNYCLDDVWVEHNNLERLLHRDIVDGFFDTLPVASPPNVLGAFPTLPDVSDRVRGMFRMLLGVEMGDSAIADTAAFGPGRQFDTDSVIASSASRFSSST